MREELASTIEIRDGILMVAHHPVDQTAITIGVLQKYKNPKSHENSYRVLFVQNQSYAVVLQSFREGTNLMKRDRSKVIRKGARL